MSVAFVRVSLHRVRVSPTIKKVKKTIRILYRLFTYIYGTECTGPSGRAARPVFGDRLYRRSTQIKYTLPIKVHFTVPSMGNGIIRLYDIL